MAGPSLWQGDNLRLVHISVFGEGEMALWTRTGSDTRRASCSTVDPQGNCWTEVFEVLDSLDGIPSITIFLNDGSKFFHRPRVRRDEVPRMWMDFNP